MAKTMFKIKTLASLLVSLLFISVSFAQQRPWFTGPIENNFNVMLEPEQLYIFPDIYRDKFNPFTSYGGYLQLAYQYTETWQLQLIPRYNYNTNVRGSSHDWGNLPILLGYQLTRQQSGSRLPAIKLNIKQTFPTSRYENFNPRKGILERTGSAFYETAFLINTQYLSMPFPGHYMKRYITIEYDYRPRKHITGFNAYGGGFGTEGTMSSNQHFNADLAYELQFTQNWVGLFQWYYIYVQSSSFHGNPGVNADGSTARTFNPTRNQWSLFPLIEYNFSSNIGLDFGFWFSLNDREYKFRDIHLALNYVS